MLALVPLSVLVGAVVWLGVTLSFRYVSLGTLLGSVCGALGAAILGYPGPHVVAAFGVAAIIVARHHANIARLLAGHEPKVGQRRTSA
jgi:glycerol-3-phosphate acyltransferase PlsY